MPLIIEVLRNVISFLLCDNAMKVVLEWYSLDLESFPHKKAGEFLGWSRVNPY